MPPERIFRLTRGLYERIFRSCPMVGQGSEEAMSNITICGMRIRTCFIHPPIPIRDNDWLAVTDDYEPGQPVGSSRTEAAAVKDLMEQITDEDARTIMRLFETANLESAMETEQ
jgi:hypothetical protein